MALDLGGHMSKKLHTGWLILLTWYVMSCGAVAAERATAEEAQAMVARAIAAYKAEGKTVFTKMTAPSTEFRDRDLYVFVIGPDHKVVAHGLDAKRIGHDVTKFVDSDGKAYGKEFIAKASESGSWVDYKRTDPLTNQVMSKSSWVVLYDGYIFGSGIYTK
jgi:signal transduction histidine kinase